MTPRADRRRDAPRGRPEFWWLLGLAIVGGVLLWRHDAARTPVAGPSSCTTTGLCGASAPVAAAPAGAQAAQAAAQLAAADAAAADARQALTQAQQDAQQVMAAASAQLARNPAAQAPSLTALQSDQSRVASDLRQAQQAGAPGDAAAQQVGAIATRVGALVTQAQAALQTWQQVHSAPPGYLGVAYRDPAPNSGVSGCEVVRASGPAAQAGLVGSTQRTDPVGDVISEIVDQTDGNTAWPIPSCSAFLAAMAQTRAGDVLTLSYYHRQVIWYLFSGTWKPETAQATLTASACPSPVTGRVQATRIHVTLEVTGPSGSQQTPAIVDTGGASGWFDAGWLESLGYRPVPGSRYDAGGYLGAPAGAVGYAFRIAFPSIENNQGQFVPLGQGSVVVQGVVGLAADNGVSRAGLGPPQMAQVDFQTDGATWSISWPSCGA